jgi:NAD(P)-dependent dehydrogenase (short-subunit alcohol dehydrogenase family)
MTGERARIAVVTGGGSGIGLAIAHALAGAGHALVIAGRDLARLEAAAASLRRDGARVVAARCDVTEAADVTLLERRATALAQALGGAVDVLVSDAGAVAVHDLLAGDAATWRDMFAVNHLGAVRVAEAFLPGMVECGGGLVVQVASAAALRAFPGIGAYAAAKHALLGWSRAAACELAAQRAARGLTGGPAVSVLCPYYVRGEMLERAVAGLAAERGIDPVAARAHFAGRNPGGALVEPQAIGALVAELAREAAADPAAVNGRVVVLDGGPPRPPAPDLDLTT